VKRELKVKGNSVDERFKNIELILQRMSKKMNGKIIGVLPVSPVFEFAYVPDNEGVVMRRLFPASGRITKIGIAFDEKGKKPVKVVFNVENSLELRSFSNSYMIKRFAQVITADFEIKAGDKITVSITPEEGEEVKGIWIGFTYEIALSEMNQKEFILSELERMVEDEVISVDGDE